MLTTLVAIYTIYVALNIYVSVMQIGYVAHMKFQTPVILKAADFLKAGSYTVKKERINIASTFINYIVFIFWLGYGIDWLTSYIHFSSPSATNVAIVMSFVVLNSLVSLPFEYYEKMVLDKEFGFNNTTLKQYIKDNLIAFVLTLVFGSLVTWGVYEIMANFELWWLWSFVFIFGVIILINMFFPTIRAMFFDKLTPLEDGELRSAIEELMQKTGFNSQGIYVSDASKRDSRLNAYFGGLGKTKRVVLFDTLIEKLNKKELLAVLGHELGHFAHGDIYKNIAMMGAMLFVVFFAFGNIPEDLYMELGVPQIPAVTMILFLLFMPVIGFIMMPIMGFVSRHNEFEADRMGSELGGPTGNLYLASALKKLVQENKSFPLSHPLYIFFYYTHPSVVERLKKLDVNVGYIDEDGMKEKWSPENLDL
ncbi:MAG: M48 family metallopeptidase [Epsilonproteobacteria bacterium]|nr:M48 family metallopeptidase [Campylobacterota bacterium]